MSFGTTKFMAKRPLRTLSVPEKSVFVRSKNWNAVSVVGSFMRHVRSSRLSLTTTETRPLKLSASVSPSVIWPAMRTRLLARSSGSVPPDVGMPLMLSTTHPSSGVFRDKAGSPRREYWSLLSVLSRPVSTRYCFARRLASPNVVRCEPVLDSA